MHVGTAAATVSTTPESQAHDQEQGDERDPKLGGVHISVDCLSYVTARFLNTTNIFPVKINVNRHLFRSHIDSHLALLEALHIHNDVSSYLHDLRFHIESLKLLFRLTKST